MRKIIQIPKIKNKIMYTLLNRNAHYDLIYTYDEYNKYSDIYSCYEINESKNKLE